MIKSRANLVSFFKKIINVCSAVDMDLKGISPAGMDRRAVVVGGGAERGIFEITHIIPF